MRFYDSTGGAFFDTGNESLAFFYGNSAHTDATFPAGTFATAGSYTYDDPNAKGKGNFDCSASQQAAAVPCQPGDTDLSPPEDTGLIRPAASGLFPSVGMGPSRPAARDQNRSAGTSPSKSAESQSSWIIAA